MGKDGKQNFPCFWVTDEQWARFQKMADAGLFQLRRNISDLEDNGAYQAYTHFALMCLGFSRGAALARHFINALAQEGLPDYERTRTPLQERSHLNAVTNSNPIY